jgi:hypothetical protein
LIVKAPGATAVQASTGVCIVCVSSEWFCVCVGERKWRWCVFDSLSARARGGHRKTVRLAAERQVG